MYDQTHKSLSDIPIITIKPSNNPKLSQETLDNRLLSKKNGDPPSVADYRSHPGYHYKWMARTLQEAAVIFSVLHRDMQSD